MPAAVRIRWAPATVDDDSGRLDYAYEAARQIREALPDDHPTLGDYVTVVERHPQEDPLGTYPFATIDRTTGEVRPRDVTDTAYPPADLLVIQPGDIVLSGIDLVNGSVGSAKEDVADMVVSKEFYTLRVRPEREGEVDPRFLALFLRTPHARELIAGTVTGTSNRTRIEDVSALLGLPLPALPDVTEQKALADAVSDALDQRRSARIAIQQALREADRNWGFDVGESEDGVEVAAEDGEDA